MAAPSLELCLDYCNTRYWRGLPVPTETLPDFAAWQRWLRDARVVDADTALALHALARDDPAQAQQLFAAALQVREALYRLFSAAAPTAADDDARQLVQWLAAAPPRAVLALDGEGQRAGWRVPMIAPTVTEVLAPVLWSAADLVLARHRVALRCCANEQCRWLFVDASKGGTRVWCSMSACGNRAKARRHAQRQRERGGG